MKDEFLILTLLTASLGFIIWYMLSTSYLLPVRFQVLYDANPPYVSRIFRRRFLGGLIYGIIPLFVIWYTGLLGRPSLSDLNISFHWNHRVSLWLLILIPVVLIANFIMTKKTSSLEQFPEVRVRFWRPGIYIWSAIWWIFYLAAYEFFYRGLLLQSLLFYLSDELAILAATAIYALTHYFKRNRVSFFSIFYGALACYMVLDTGSILPVIILHIVSTLSLEWSSVRHHPEMYFLKT
ncbi:MAG TPA: CPBP family intramembrane glutamic endopeptidase [Saprospiraceae bacterium]|nr:CPBP family intramembrane glutamic endopeptidase [Saprospiraceae bacterium]